MPLSKECQEYHLTPRGWIQGTFRGDALGGLHEVETPPDRVLTIGCYDVLPSAFSQPYSYDKVLWECGDKSLIERLQAVYGKLPEGKED